MVNYYMESKVIFGPQEKESNKKVHLYSGKDGSSKRDFDFQLSWDLKNKGRQRIPLPGYLYENSSKSYLVERSRISCTVLIASKGAACDRFLQKKENYCSLGSILDLFHVLKFKPLPTITMNKAQLTRNIFLITNGKKNVSPTTLTELPPASKPLVIMPTWLMATDKPIFKYAKFYLQHGFDVLNIQITLWQLLWPVKGTQVLAADILKFLEKNRNYAPLVVHGFSIGCYLWGEVLVLINDNRSRYQFVIDNMVGQIWDSPADITRIPTGVSYATFPNSKFLQNALKSYATYHLNTFYDVATTHYLKSRSAVYNNPVRKPILVYASKADPISSEDTIRSICDYWEEGGIKVYLKIWDDTAHVSHMHKYPLEYLEELSRYLKEIGGITKEIKFKANL